MSDDVTTPDPDAGPIVDPVSAALVERFPGSAAVDSHAQPVVYVARDVWHDIAVALRDDERFTQCVDVTAVDHSADVERVAVEGVEPERFEVVANYLSHPRNLRIRLITEVPESDPRVASIADVFPGVNFAEREVFDMFGIEFEGHPDLARILMPDDWEGYPLRKDDHPARIPVTFKGDPPPR